MISRFATLLLVVFFAAASPAVWAQSNATGTANDAASQATAEAAAPLDDPSAWQRIFETTEQAITREGLTDQDLNRLFDEMGTIRERALERIKALQPELQQFQQQLNELGPAPKEGEPPEAEEVQTQRKTLEKAFGEIDAQQKEARLNEVRAQQLRTTISKIRNERFVQFITERSEGLSTPKFWGNFVSGFDGYGRGLYLLISDSFAVFVDRITSQLRNPLLLVLLLSVAGLVYTRSRRFVHQLLNSDEDTFSSERGGNAAAAFLSYIRNGILPGIFVYAIYRIFSGLGLLTLRFDQLFASVAIVIGFAIAGLTLLRLFLAPTDGLQRLSSMRDLAVRRIYTVLSTALALAFVALIAERIGHVLVVPLEVSIGLSIIFALIVGCASIWTLFVARQDRLERMEFEGQSLVTGRFWRLLLLLLWLLAVVIIMAVLSGYVALAEFISEQLLFGLMIILSAWLLLRFIDYVFLHLPAQSALEEGGSDAARVGEQMSGQAIILGAGLSKMAVYLAAGIMMLLPWGYRTADFFQFVSNIFFGFEVGGLSFSLASIFLAFGLFIVGYTVTVALRAWLRNQFLPTTSLDIGVSNSISTMFGYAGFILAGILAVTAAGFELSNLAIVAGALSVGVGFGLQSIVNNFVSGLILLAERPIKAGDWVVTAGGEGYVRKISVRSTEIETFDRATVIVPNSTLITDNVTNWTHENTAGRIIIPVGVGYDSDPDQVREILLGCAKDHPKILGRPAPIVFFVDFGASSLDFQLRCHLGDINYAMSVSSDLRFEILRALRGSGIEIPFPQQDVHIRSNASPQTVKQPKRAPARTTRGKSSK